MTRTTLLYRWAGSIPYDFFRIFFHHVHHINHAHQIIFLHIFFRVLFHIHIHIQQQRQIPIHIDHTFFHIQIPWAGAILCCTFFHDIHLRDGFESWLTESKILPQHHQKRWPLHEYKVLSLALRVRLGTLRRVNWKVFHFPLVFSWWFLSPILPSNANGRRLQFLTWRHAPPNSVARPRLLERPSIISIRRRLPFLLRRRRLPCTEAATGGLPFRSGTPSASPCQTSWP